MAQSTSISYREFWRRWLPRLLGITPLLVFGKGLIGIGPDGQGMGMVAVLGVLILLLLLIYTEVSLLSDPREEPANPALALVHNWVSDLANPGQREQS